MKKNNDELFFSSLLRQLASMAPSMWYFLAAIVIAAVGLVFLGPSALGSRNSLRSIQPGKVADSDVYAGKDTVYVDKEATQRKILAEERLVLAVFVLDDKITSAVREKAEAFASYYRQLAGEPGGVDALSLLLRSRFPDLFQPELYTVLVRAKLNAQAFVYVSDIVESMLGKGVVSLPDGVFDQFNPNYYELVRTLGTRQESEQLPVNGMITLANLGNRLDDEMDARHVPESMKQYVRLLGKALLRENVFFDQGLSEKRIAAARARVEPVTRFVSRNEILVRKGELVTPELYQQIKTIRSAILVSDVGVLMTGLGLLIVASLLGFMLARVKDLSDFPSDRSSLLFLLSSLLILLYWILVIQNVIDSKSLSRGALLCRLLSVRGACFAALRAADGHFLQPDFIFSDGCGDKSECAVHDRHSFGRNICDADHADCPNENHARPRGNFPGYNTSIACNNTSAQPETERSRAHPVYGSWSAQWFCGRLVHSSPAASFRASSRQGYTVPSHGTR